MDLRGATIGLAGKEKSSKKNVIEVSPSQTLSSMLSLYKSKSGGYGPMLSVVAMPTRALVSLFLGVAEESERLGVPDPVRHGEHHQRLAQGHLRHHQATGESGTRSPTTPSGNW